MHLNNPRNIVTQTGLCGYPENQALKKKTICREWSLNNNICEVDSLTAQLGSKQKVIEESLENKTLNSCMCEYNLSFSQNKHAILLDFACKNLPQVIHWHPALHPPSSKDSYTDKTPLTKSSIYLSSLFCSQIPFCADCKALHFYLSALRVCEHKQRQVSKAHTLWYCNSISSDCWESQTPPTAVLHRHCSVTCYKNC